MASYENLGGFTFGRVANNLFEMKVASYENSGGFIFGCVANNLFEMKVAGQVRNPGGFIFVYEFRTDTPHKSTNLSQQTAP